MIGKQDIHELEMELNKEEFIAESSPHTGSRKMYKWDSLL